MSLLVLDLEEAQKVSGVVGKVYLGFFEGAGVHKVKAAFFKPYQQNALQKFGTIFTAPLALTAGIIFNFTLAAVNTLLSIGCLLLGSPSKALTCLKQGASLLGFALLSLLLLPLSPIINLVDFIGSGITTALTPASERVAPSHSL